MFAGGATVPDGKSGLPFVKTIAKSAGLSSSFQQSADSAQSWLRRSQFTHHESQVTQRTISSTVNAIDQQCDE